MQSREQTTNPGSWVPILPGARPGAPSGNLRIAGAQNEDDHYLRLAEPFPLFGRVELRGLEVSSPRPVEVRLSLAI